MFTLCIRLSAEFYDNTKVNKELAQSWTLDTKQRSKRCWEQVKIRHPWEGENGIPKGNIMTEFKEAALQSWAPEPGRPEFESQTFFLYNYN